MPAYLIRHHTRYRYSASILESVMEARMCPRTEQGQHCHRFHLSVKPSAVVRQFVDHWGNRVDWFTVPARHGTLTMQAETLVEVNSWDVAELESRAASWEAIEALGRGHDTWDWLSPSRFARPTDLLAQFARDEQIERGPDPLTTLQTINRRIYDAFAYTPESTAVDSLIDEALAHRRGVCQDYTHIFIALARGLGIPCRYVSGYLFHWQDSHDRSAEDASHAWAEALLPSLGWIGFDPTNHLIAHGRHIRVAVGRDYADVPPTKGVFRGSAESELDVGVQVMLAETPAQEEELIPVTGWTPPDDVDADLQQAQQQQ